jgi:hypothetical protein
MPLWVAAILLPCRYGWPAIGRAPIPMRRRSPALVATTVAALVLVEFGVRAGEPLPLPWWVRGVTVTRSGGVHRPGGALVRVAGGHADVTDAGRALRALRCAAVRRSHRAPLLPTDGGVPVAARVVVQRRAPAPDDRLGERDSIRTVKRRPHQSVPVPARPACPVIGGQPAQRWTTFGPDRT